MSHVTASQIRHFLSLDEQGDGLGEAFDAFIRQVTSGGIAKKTPDIRRKQAKKLWDGGFVRHLNLAKFADYLVTIPEIPASLLVDNPELPLLVLVDPRVGHENASRLLGLKFAEYGYNDETLVPRDDRHAMPTTPYWVRAHDGSPNLNRKPSDCRAECTGKLYAGTADVGIAIVIQHGKRNHIMDLSGSVHRDVRDCGACLDAWGVGPGLGADGYDVAFPGCGTVVFVRE